METETSRTHSNNERCRRPERGEKQKTMEHERKRRKKKERLKENCAVLYDLAQ